MSRRLATGALALVLAACTAPPPDLVAGTEVIHHLLRPRHLSKSPFSVLFEDPKPSDFVSYIFSDMGLREWSLAPATGPDANWPIGRPVDEPEQLRAIGAPVPPPGIHFAARAPVPGKAKQVVVGYDDATNMIIVTGYVAGSAEPALVREWPLPTGVRPEPGVREFTRGHIEKLSAYFQVSPAVFFKGIIQKPRK